jgi:hypothetical protein
VIEGVVSKPQLTPSVTTAKTTLGHSATVAARATSKLDAGIGVRTHIICVRIVV